MVMGSGITLLATTLIFRYFGLNRLQMKLKEIKEYGNDWAVWVDIEIRLSVF